MVRYAFALVALMGAVAPVGAANGLSGLFDTLSHDFGNVPIGPQLQHTFYFKNNTTHSLHIGSVRVSCGCVSAAADGRVIAPGQTGFVHASMDTKRFVGTKSVTVFVTFDQPQLEEVRLVVNAYGRNDITLSPENLAFGTVRKGVGGTASTTLNLTGGARVTEAACESGYIKLAMEERTSPNGIAQYSLKATLRSDIPVGKWYTDVWVKTTHGETSRIRIPLTVEVEPSLMVTPGSVQFDAAKAGQAPTKKQVFVRGSQPFRIVEVKGGDGIFTAAALTTDARPVHILTLTFAPGKEGDFLKTLKIVTDLKDDNQVEVQVRGHAQ